MQRLIFANVTFGAACVNQVCNAMHAAACVQAHRDVLENVQPEQGKMAHQIPLPFEVQRSFCRHHDWEQDNHTQEIEIGACAQDNGNLPHLHQHVCILHIELAGIKHGQVDPMSPGGSSVLTDQPVQSSHEMEMGECHSSSGVVSSSVPSGASEVTNGMAFLWTPQCEVHNFLSSGDKHCE